MAERNYLSTPARAEGLAPERSAQEIRQDIAAKRDSITETVDRLGERVQETFDWRTYIADYPWVAVGVAVGVGWLCSSFFKPRPTPRERIMDALAEGLEDVTDRLRHTLNDLPQERSGIGRTVKAAAAGMITKAAVDYLKGRLNGALEERETSDALPPEERMRTKVSYTDSASIH